MAHWKKLTAEVYHAMTEEERKGLMREVCQGFAECCFEDAIRTGTVDPHGKSELELNIELLKFTLDHLDAVKAAGDISWIIDHKKELLREARRYRRIQKHEFAVLFYATWSEHWLNSLIQTACQQMKLTADSIELIIRDTQFRAKATWVLQLLGLPPISAALLATITELQNLRNGFVHYKFRPHGEEGMKQLDKQLEAAANRAEGMVRTLTQYENQHIFKRGRTKARCLAQKIRRQEEAPAPGLEVE
jgi:hypothetical protein